MEACVCCALFQKSHEEPKRVLASRLIVSFLLSLLPNNWLWEGFGSLPSFLSVNSQGSSMAAGKQREKSITWPACAPRGVALGDCLEHCPRGLASPASGHWVLLTCYSQSPWQPKTSATPPLHFEMAVRLSHENHRIRLMTFLFQNLLPSDKWSRQTVNRRYSSAHDLFWCG